MGCLAYAGMQGIKLSLLADTQLAPGQTRILPIRISQSKPFDGDTLSFKVHAQATSGGTSLVLVTQVSVSRLGHWSGTGTVAIKASYFSADRTPIGFIVLPPTDSNAPSRSPCPPILALRLYMSHCSGASAHGFPVKTDGAGLDIFKQPFWPEAVPRQRRSWVILPSGRTPWVRRHTPSVR
jgi:hypothetical protein